MIRPFALVGFSAYGALVLCAAVGPGNSWVLALLCLGLACGIALFRLGLGIALKYVTNIQVYLVPKCKFRGENSL